ncbi:MAG: capsule assembly Wzi family protein [Ignavibacteria bacterium]
MKKILLIIFITLISSQIYSQLEYAPVNHPVYDYLKRMSLKGVIQDYNSASLPLSRQKISEYLVIIESSKSKIGKTDSKILNDYLVEFSYDINSNLKKSYSLFSDFKSFSVFDNDRQKYLYAFNDSNVSFFWDATGFVSQRSSKGDSLGNNSILLGEVGTRFRGTLFNSVGYYLRMSNGQKIKGDQKDIDFAIATNPKFKANTKFTYENSNFDTYEGYLKYSTPNEWLSLIAGKEALTYGYGYIDKLFLSTNTVPFSFLKLDLSYKSIKYSFLYGSLKGDSLGRDIANKNIATHRLDVRASNKLRFGFWESLIIADNAFNFTYLNPLSFLRSADYNAGENKPVNKNNALMGFDFEYQPISNVSFQSSLLIDDLNFATIFDNNKDGNPGNDNRFGYQVGAMWTDAFTIPNLTASLEYTKLDPFVYTHRTNKSQYTNWTLPLGHHLSPNSDEIAVKLAANIYNRLNASLTYQHQRTASKIVMSGDTLIANYGGDINRGDGDVIRSNQFLDGNRVDKDVFMFALTFEPIRQFFIDFEYQFTFYDLIYSSRKLKDNYFFGTIRVDF